MDSKVKQFRIARKNEIVRKISEGDHFIRLTSNSVRNLKENKHDEESTFTYVDLQIKKRNLKIKEYKEKIKELRKLLILLKNGDLDAQLNIEADKNLIKSTQNREKELEKYKERRKAIKVKTDKLKEKRESEYKSRKSISQTRRDMNYAFKYYSNITIPDYMARKLKYMPNNKGYVWRGVYFYGKKLFMIPE